ncbi:MAG: hypothetical protein V7676_10455 [Parasphingorhabdus sp.]|uniref:hypothetical protein n=1 Tax=Parasphingorhabdus sp. TaxID=2709688 RepID=UPI003002D48B
MKSILYSGLIGTSLLLASCAAGDDSADSAVNEVTPNKVTGPIDPAAAHIGYLAEMQGRWTSKEDAAQTIEIEGSGFQTLHDGKPQDDMAIIFVDSCQSRARDMNGKAFVLRGKEKQTCYLLYSVAKENLSYIDGTRGRTSRFTREN